MKKVLIFLVAAVILFSTPVSAANYAERAVEKAKQGFTNLVTGWLEVPYQTVKGFKSGFGEKEKNKLLGGFVGIFRGCIHGAGRTASGVYEVATFALPNPKDNEGVGVPLDSRYVWEDGKHYSVLNQGLKPIGKKALRGTINAGLGILDMPAQMNKGFGEGHPFKGLGKAIVFPIARVASGVYDVVTFLLPNDTENYGYPLEEKYPWDAFEKNRYRNGL
ncbi:MAG: hypothetical protein Q8O30_11695 [Candidatus Omnitrophota bacterium]|nr:hypothetical protein [Candidatus Omnitrophota bacterium]